MTVSGIPLARHQNRVCNFAAPLAAILGKNTASPVGRHKELVADRANFFSGLMLDRDLARLLEFCGTFRAGLCPFGSPCVFDDPSTTGARLAVLDCMMGTRMFLAAVEIFHPLPDIFGHHISRPHKLQATPGIR